MVHSHPTGGGVPCPTPEQLLTDFGFSLFPVSRDKSPAIKSWRRFQKEKPSKDTLAEWRSKGSDFGLPMGPVSGFLVIDTDTPWGEEWVKGKVPKTPLMTLTGAHPETGYRGCHRFYRYPPDLEQPIKNRTSVTAPGLERRKYIDPEGKEKFTTGVDIRGFGGYVVAPGSKHKTGVYYEVTRRWDPDDLERVPFYDPAWFDPPASDSQETPATPAPPPRVTSSTYDDACKWLSKRETPYEGERNHACYSTAAHLFDFGLSLSEVEGLMVEWNRSFSSPLDEPSLLRTVASAETTRQAPKFPKQQNKGVSRSGGGDSDQGAVPPGGSADVAELPDGDDGGGKSNQFDRLMQVCEEQFPFFFDNGTAYLSPGDSLAVPLESKKADHFIRHTFYKVTGQAASTENVSKLIGIKTAELSIEGPNCPVFRRVGKVGEKHYLDLCHEGKVIELTADGWKVVSEPEGVYFIRSGATEEALPIPEPGGDVLALQQVVNVSLDTLKLIVVYLVCALRRGFPYIIQVLEGEAGSAKTTLGKIQKFLIDPCKVLLRRIPGSERDMAVFAFNSHLLALDNIDRITPNQSDMFCCMSTGGGISNRTHHTMQDETVIDVQKPVLLTGIDGLVERGDMADRVILIQLERLPETKRMKEEDLWRLIERIRPQVLGGLLDAFCAALKNIDKVKLDRLPRMADFAAFATAAEAGLPWEQGDALAAYYRARANLFDQALDRDRVALAVVNFMVREESFGRPKWEGTPAELLGEIEPPFGGEDRWPTIPATLIRRIQKAAPLLREQGIVFYRRKSNGVRFVGLKKNSPSEPSLPSLPSLKEGETPVNTDFSAGTDKNSNRPCTVPVRPCTVPVDSDTGTDTQNAGTDKNPNRPCQNPVATRERDGRDDRDGNAGMFSYSAEVNGEGRTGPGLHEGWESGII